MEPVEVQNIVNQENKETKTFSPHPAIFVIIFLIILGCIIGVAAGPIYLLLDCQLFWPVVLSFLQGFSLY